MYYIPSILVPIGEELAKIFKVDERWGSDNVTLWVHGIDRTTFEMPRLVRVFMAPY